VRTGVEDADAETAKNSSAMSLKFSYACSLGTPVSARLRFGLKALRSNLTIPPLADDSSAAWCTRLVESQPFHSQHIRKSRPRSCSSRILRVAWIAKGSWGSGTTTKVTDTVCVLTLHYSGYEIMLTHHPRSIEILMRFVLTEDAIEIAAIEEYRNVHFTGL